MDLDKQYYSISEVAKLFKVNASKLRYWEAQFPHLLPKRTESGIRKYTPVDIEKINVLVDLIDVKGLTIEGAKHALTNKGAAKNPNQVVINQLTDIRDFLQVLSQELAP
jgi:DNA-binding transcriptional MerR regulator